MRLECNLSISNIFSFTHFQNNAFFVYKQNENISGGNEGEPLLMFALCFHCLSC